MVFETIFVVVFVVFNYLWLLFQKNANIYIGSPNQLKSKQIAKYDEKNKPADDNRNMYYYYYYLFQQDYQNSDSSKLYPKYSYKQNVFNQKCIEMFHCIQHSRFMLNFLDSYFSPYKPINCCYFE